MRLEKMTANYWIGSATSRIDDVVSRKKSLKTINLENPRKENIASLEERPRVVYICGFDFETRPDDWSMYYILMDHNMNNCILFQWVVICKQRRNFFHLQEGKWLVSDAVTAWWLTIGSSNPCHRIFPPPTGKKSRFQWFSHVRFKT